MKIINLLPKSRQKELRYEALFKSARFFAILSLVSFILVFAAQVGARFYLGAQVDVLQGEIEALQAQVGKPQNGEIKTKVKAANDLVLDFKTLIDASPKWSKLIKTFSVLPPDGVRITSFVVDQAQKSIQISGQSPTRELVIQLYNNILEDTNNFYGIDYPLENVSKPLDISFHFTFNFKDELIK